MKKVTETLLFKGQWLEMRTSEFVNERGETFHWEHIGRTKRDHAVVILATLRPSNRVVFIRQFRPGINGNVIGLPAGLAESNDPGEDALRELREEAGFVGKVISVSPVLTSYPALSAGTVQLVQVDVDESLPENRAPQQELEPGEEIEVILVPRADASQFLQQQVDAGTAVVSGIWYLFAVSA